MSSIDTSDMGLRVYPDPVLKTKAEPLALPLPDNIEEVGNIMLEIMYDSNGIGLAGNQAGLLHRVIVFDLSPDQDDPNILINPEIVASSKNKVKEEEGCLSFPEINGYVIRHESVTVKGYNIKGEEVTMEGSELKAAMFQHEIDHLDGITFVDRLGATGKMKVRRALQDLESGYPG